MEEFNIRDFLIHFLSNYDFIENFQTKIRQDNDKEIQERIIDKGVFKKEHGFYAVIDMTYSYKIKKIIKEKIKDLNIVDQVYLGEEYVLALSGGKNYSFRKELYNEILTLIDELYYADVISKESKHFVGTMINADAKALIIKTDIAYFIIAGITTDQTEEERIILSSKLEKAQPFFKVLAPQYYNWNKLKENRDSNFEKIIELLLQKERGINRVIPIGKTNAADRGRDFEVIENLISITEKFEKKWLVQCKFSTKSISPDKIAGWIERVIEHNYDGYWLITNSDLTPSLIDQFKDVQKNDNYTFDVRFWQRSDLHIKMNLYNELFNELDLFD